MIVVTGGCGFIGSRILEELFNKGYNEKVVVVDYLTDDNVRKISKFPIYDFIEPKYFLAQSNALAKDAKCIFHQGAITDTTHPEPKEVMAMNFSYTKALISSCILNKTKIIYASSAAIYGNGKNGFKEEVECEAPLNVYGFSKCLIDNWLRQSNIFSSYNIFGLRYFNVYGMGEEHKKGMSSPVYKFFNDAISLDKNIKIFKGSHKFYRDFVAVEDVVNVNLSCAFGDIAPGIYNVGSGKKISFKKVAKLTQEHFSEEKVNLSTIDFPEKLKGRYQDNTHANLVKLRSAGYKEKMIDPEVGIKKYLLDLDLARKNEDSIY
jgi:ADP-L-glycero-D-manno-heptose 6-epimerase